MNQALLSSKNNNWCTPQDFFDDLNSEFHFVLDVAANEKSAKCKDFFTPEQDGLLQSWERSDGAVSVIHRMDGRSESGQRKRLRKAKKVIRKLCF